MEHNPEIQKNISELANKYDIPEEIMKSSVEILSELLSDVLLHLLSTNVRFRQLLSSLLQDF